MLAGNKRSYVIKQTCSFSYDLFLPLDIKGLIHIAREAEVILFFFLRMIQILTAPHLHLPLNTTYSNEVWCRMKLISFDRKVIFSHLSSFESL